MHDDASTSGERIPSEIELRWLEYQQRQAELTRLARLDEDQRKFNSRSLHQSRSNAVWSILIGSLTVLVSAAAVVFAVVNTNRSSAERDQEFESTQRSNYFTNIIDGLGSNSAAVQATSMRLLTAYETDPANFGGEVKARNNGVSDELRTLSAFIRDASIQRSPEGENADHSEPTHEETTGLGAYSRPLPIIIDRAMREVTQLTDEKSLGNHGVDLSSANLHGVSLNGFRPTGTLTAVGADLRRADLGNSILRHGSSLSGAFLTCANLQDADLGDSSVVKTDFYGANLSGADLSQVQGLESQQLAGVTIDADTRLPTGITLPPVAQVGYDEPTCTMIVDKMTGMEPNMGYAKSMPCPIDVSPWPDSYPALARFSGNRQYLVDVCRARG